MSKPLITVRVGAPVAAGKTHVAETIRKALLAEYGEDITICVALTDIEHDKRSLEGGPERPPQGATFKIVECHGKR